MINKNEIRDKVFTFAMSHNMLNKADKVVAGVSGGADSMCLLGLLLEWREILGIEIFVIHVNHGIRGAAADEDERFVEEFCKSNAVAFEAIRADIPKMADLSGCTEEEEGRNLRYRVFADAAAKFGCNRIAVAHNRSDNAETVIFNILRGSGFSGLKGISPVRSAAGNGKKTAVESGEMFGRMIGAGNCEISNSTKEPLTIIRPLLNTSREEIETYLRERGIAFRTDATNFENEYSRNVLRNIVFPTFKEKINSASEEHIVRLAQQAAELDAFLTGIVKTRMAEMETEGKLRYVIADRSTDQDGGSQDLKNPAKHVTGCRIDSEALAATESIIRRMIIRDIVGKLAGRLKDITNTHIEDVESLLDKQVGRRIDLPYGLIVRRDYDDLVIERKNETPAASDRLDDKEWLIEKTELIRYFEGSRWSEKIDITDIGGIEKSECGVSKCETDTAPYAELSIYCTDKIPDTDFTKNLYTKLFDCDKIKNGVSIRTRRSGDFLMLRGKGGGLVRKSLKSWFIDNKVPADIRNRLLLFAEDSHVLWIIGYRRDDSCLIDDDTKNIMVAELAL